MEFMLVFSPTHEFLSQFEAFVGVPLKNLLLFSGAHLYLWVSEGVINSNEYK